MKPCRGEGPKSAPSTDVRHANSTGYQSSPPIGFTACAGARGFARHGTPDGDALLVWYRSHGTARVSDVERYLARRAMVACWPCDDATAVATIRAAMEHVRAGRTSRLSPMVGLRKERYQAWRAQASAWLRAGIMEAEWRYGLARG